jgi:phage/plasmid-associated DNA primase
MFPGGCRSALPPAKWSENFMTCKLDGPLINICGELSERTKVDGEMFKKVVDGSELTGRHLFAEGYEFRPVCAHWFASNHMPVTEDTSAGFTKRWIVAAFKRRVRPEDMDRNLAESIIAEERERIVVWAVSAIGDVIERGSILEPASSAAHVASLSANLNPIRGWFGDKIELKEGVVLGEDAAYLAYQSYVLTKGLRKMTRTTFRSTMQEQAGTGRWVCEDLGDGSQRYIGIRLKKG